MNTCSRNDFSLTVHEHVFTKLSIAADDELNPDLVSNFFKITIKLVIGRVNSRMTATNGLRVQDDRDADTGFVASDGLKKVPG